MPMIKAIPVSQEQELDELKKQKIAAEMRAKHLGLTQSSNFKLQNNLLHKNLNNKMFSTAIALPALTGPNNGLMEKKLKTVPTPRPESMPEDNYDISDKEESDDEDEFEGEPSKPRKYIPLWAQKEKLLPALEKQFSHVDDNYIDPDELFGEVESCDLKAIFGSPRKKGHYQRRTSSGNWTNDRATVAEKLEYRREHKLRLLGQATSSATATASSTPTQSVY